MYDIDKVGIICIRDRKVLLTQKRGLEQLIILGGKPEPGESHEDCARREALEEAQCSLDNIQYFDTFSGRRVDKEGIITLHCYTATLIGDPQVRPGDSVIGLHWQGIPYDPLTLTPTLRHVFSRLEEKRYL